MQHAREWLAGETCRRTLSYFSTTTARRRAPALEVDAELVNTRELWFVCVNNPDGYEYTFTAGNRLWRKNMGDNNNNGIIGEPDDGVDPNRNFAANWGRDDEGSSPDPLGDLPRPGAESEPETKAMEALFDRDRLRSSRRTTTRRRSCCCTEGLPAGHADGRQRDLRRARGRSVPARHRGLPARPVGAGLYITNGDLTDGAYSTQKTLSYTPEGTAAEDPNVTGLRVPGLALQVDRSSGATCSSCSTSRSRPRPDRAVLAPGQRRVEDFVVDSFAESYGDPQQVQVTVQRKLGDVTMSTASTAARSSACRPRSSPAASATTRRTASTTTACAARHGHQAGRLTSRSGYAPAARRS